MPKQFRTRPAVQNARFFACDLILALSLRQADWTAAPDVAAVDEPPWMGLKGNAESPEPYHNRSIGVSNLSAAIWLRIVEVPVPMSVIDDVTSNLPSLLTITFARAGAGDIAASQFSSHAPTDQFFVLAHRPRRVTALVPAKALASLSIAFAQSLAAEGSIFALVPLRVVCEAQSQRVGPEGVSQLVHCGFQRKHSRRRTRSAHVTWRNSVEFRQFVVEFDVVAAIEASREKQNRILGILELRGGGNGLMPDRLKRPFSSAASETVWTVLARYPAQTCGRAAAPAGPTA